MIDSLTFCSIKVRHENVDCIDRLAAQLEKYCDNPGKYEGIYDHVPEKSVRRLLARIHDIAINHFRWIDTYLPDKRRAAQYWEKHSKEIKAAISSARELQRLLLGSSLSLAIPDRWESVFSGCDDGGVPCLVETGAHSVKNEPMFMPVREAKIVVGDEVMTSEATWLGCGSYANVYRFTNPFDNKDYALKAAKDDIKSKDLSAFEKEYDILSGINSAHVVRAYDYFHTTPAFTLELMDRTLGEYWQPGHGYPEDMGPRLEILAQVFAGVEDINTQGVWHRDLSPGNVLLKMGSGHITAKLSDFGVARRVSDAILEDEEVVGSFNDRDDLMRVGFGHYGLPHEIYSLTLLALYILERVEFNGHEGFNCERGQFEGVFGSVVHKGLNDNPDARYESIQSLWEGLRELVKS